MSTVPTIQSTVFPLTRKEMAAFLPTDRAIKAFEALTQDVPNVVQQSNLLTEQIDSFNFNFDALNADVSALQAEDIHLQDQIDAIGPTDAIGTITGLVDDAGVTDNWSVFKSFLAPAELGGSIIGVDGVRSDVPTSGYFGVGSTLDVDPQISMDWGTRGAVTLIPGARIQGLTPGTFNSLTRTGGFAPASVVRTVRRSPNINKQAYEGTYSFNIDATGVKASGTFTSAGTATITSSGHLRQTNDIIFFRKAADGTALPAALSDGRASKYTDSFKVRNATTNTFEVSSWNNITNDYNSASLTVTAGGGVWSTHVAGFRIPNNRAGGSLSLGTAAMDPDQDFDDKKEYTAGRLSDGDIVGVSGDGVSSEGGSGRLHIESFRALNCGLNGFDISSNDTVLSGHWGGGGNGGFTLKKGSGTGLYAVTGNVWGKPSARSADCGAIFLNDTAYFALVANQPNDWCRIDGDKNYNNSGVWGCNMFHPHGENFSSDGVSINVYNDGDLRLQTNLGHSGYQGVNYIGNSWTRSESVNVANPGGFNTPYNFGDGVTNKTDGTAGTAPMWLMWFGLNSGSTAMAQIFDGVCTAPNVKPWYGLIGKNLTITAGVVAWVNHTCVVGDRVRLHGGSLTNLTGDTVDYYVAAVVANVSISLASSVGGAVLTTASGTSVDVVKMSDSPYYVSGGSQLAGVYVDSYRGSVNLWSVNGIAPKIMIGLPYTGGQAQSWEGNPNYFIEIGDMTPHSGLANRNAAYGRWEFGSAVGYQASALDARAHSGGTFADTVKAGVRTFTESLTTTAFTTGAITLPSGVDIAASQALRVVITGKPVAALTWAFTQVGGAWKSGTPTPPATVPSAGLEVELWYEKTTDTWELKTPAFSDGGLVGRTDNVATPAGVVGEQISVKVNSGSAVACTSGSVTNLTSITLTPGDWTVTGNVQYTTNTASATSMTITNGNLNTTSISSFTTTDSTNYSQRMTATVSQTASGKDVDSIVIGGTRLTVAAGTTQQVWLNVKPTFSGGVSAWGAIRALRTT